MNGHKVFKKNVFIDCQNLELADIKLFGGDET